MLDTLEIKAIEEKDVKNVQDFLMKQLQELFNSDGQEAVTDDVWGLSDTYVHPERNQLWAAFDAKGKVLATIAICQYNGRIKLLEGRYDLSKTAEIGRCYVDETLRRQGIGAKLLQTAKTFSKEKGYEIIYLHTHHFLPGGFNFWQKNGFAIVQDEGGTYQTIHMEKPL